MRFLVDAQLPDKLCGWLEGQGYEAGYVGSLLPGEMPDRQIAAYAAEHGLVLISKDEDFVMRYPPVDYSLIWLRIGNASNRTLVAWLGPRFPRILAALEQGERLIEVR